PRRILDVGSADNNHVRLKIFDATADEIPKYACLSHCWGSSRPLSTTTANLDSHEREILWSSLPPLFQDTIAYVRRLGISLLWIDSLCIIQDDKDDWRKEAAKMASVYQNAYLVISASKSSGSEDSLFGEIDEQLKPSIIPPSALPTFNRGWIYQERILSSRILHFGPQELSWECLQESACQCTGQHTSSATIEPDMIHTMTWHMIVEDYTCLHLTFESDIFPAISGIATRFQSSLGSEYVAGMWRKSLIHDLAWHTENTSDGTPERIEWHQRPKAWRAPTWSWAAVRGQVRF
ncbi:uncharacterized protein TRIVIDRAFT_128562, partial [Trichoderma virens Gv29-8]